MAVNPKARELRRRVTEVHRRLRRGGWLVLGSWLGAAVALTLALAWLAAGPEGWGPGSVWPALVSGGLFAAAIASVAWTALTMRRRFADAPLSGILEESAELRSGELRGVLELEDGAGRAGSESLAEVAAGRVVASMADRSSAELAGRAGESLERWTRRGSVAALALVAVLALLTAVAPDRSGAAWLPLTRPLKVLDDPDLGPMTVEPGSVEILRGSPVTVTVSAPGRGENALVRWQEEGDIVREADLALDRQGYGQHGFAEVVARTRYQVRTADGSESESFVITPVDPLFVGEVTISLEYPAYTGLPSEETVAGSSTLVVPTGTLVSVEGNGSKALGRAAILDSSGAAVAELDVEEERFWGGWQPRSSGAFRWLLEDHGGEAAVVGPSPILLVLVPDRSPEVTISYPGRDTLVSPDLLQFLVIDATDDYGLDRLELIAFRTTALGEQHQPVVNSVGAEGSRQVRAQPVLDLRSWSLMPSDTVRYRARVVDRSPAGQVAESREYLLVMPASAAMQRLAEDAIEDAADELTAIAEEVTAEARANRDLARLSASDGASEGDFANLEELRESLEEQARISGEIDSLRADLAKLEELMRTTGGADEALDAELESLQELLRELLGSRDLQTRMEALADELAADEISGAADDLESLAEEQEALREKLLESLERFRRAAVEQDFRATTAEAAELARRQEAIAAAMREGDRPDERARQQHEMVESTDELAAGMERLAERLAELGEESAEEGVRDAAGTLTRAQDRMRAASAAAERNDLQAAAEEAEGAREGLEDVVRELTEAGEQMAEMAAARLQLALETAAADALALSRNQSGLRQAMIGSDPEEIAGMRVDQAALLGGLDNLAENLQLASEGAIPPGGGVWEQVGRSIEAMRRVLSTMEVRRGGAPQPQVAAESAVAELNQLSLAAQMLATQLGEGGQGSQEIADELDRIAQQQGELINEAAELMPLDLGDEAMAEQMQKMAAGQEVVSNELGELANDPSSSEALGDLERLAEEAALIAEELAGAERLTPETARRQERLFHRLLDAGRSLEREEYSEERESEEPGEFERGDPDPLTPGQMGFLRFARPDADEIAALPPALRALVLGYFDRLNRAGGGGLER